MMRIGAALIAAAMIGGVVFAAGPASANATGTSGPVSVTVVGSGRTVNQSYTAYKGVVNGPTLKGHQWAGNGNLNITRTFNIGYICSNVSLTAYGSSPAWKANSNTDFNGEWYVNGAWDGSHRPSIYIHS